MPPQAAFVTKAPSATYDPASASDDEDDVASRTSQSTWASSNAEATILGFADGAAPKELDWRTSRIGGLPTFPPLTKAPSPSAALCKLCGAPIPLLAQIYCPLDSSALERVVYMFACPSKTCRGKDASVRAYRASTPWQEEEDTPEVPAPKQEEAKGGLGSLIFGAGAPPTSNPSSNPFASPTPAVSTNPFAPPTPAPTTTNVEDVTQSLAKTHLKQARRASPEPVHWPTSLPHYAAQYLTTSYESSTPPPSIASTQAVEAMMDMDLERDAKHREAKGGRAGKTGKATSSSSSSSSSPSAGGDNWGKEGYEVQRVNGVDDVFLRFQERVARDGCASQVVRYNHSSEPLPFSAQSNVYKRLFPSPDPDSEGTFAPSRLSACAHCQMPTVFEYQLMPALVGTLNRCELINPPPSESPPSAAKKGASKVDEAEGEFALDFATAMVFSCLGECVDEQSGDGWREEVVSLELDE